MNISSKIFFVLFSVVDPGLIAAEPCANGYGAYDMTACNACAEHGKGKGQCCDAIYRNSLGRDDDDGDDSPTDSWLGFGGGCVGLDYPCDPGDGACAPGLICEYGGVPKPICQVKEDDPNAHVGAVASLLTSSSTGNTTKGGHSFVLVVVGLLGAAMMVLKVVKGRHRGLLRRHQYSDVDATPIDV